MTANSSQWVLHPRVLQPILGQEHKSSGQWPWKFPTKWSCNQQNSELFEEQLAKTLGRKSLKCPSYLVAIIDALHNSSAQTVVGHRFAGNGANGQSYYYNYYYRSTFWELLLLLLLYTLTIATNKTHNPAIWLHASYGYIRRPGIDNISRNSHRCSPAW